MAKYVLTKKAVEDLSNIWEYTYDEWSESQADIYYELLIDSFVEISVNPKMRKKYEEIEKNLLGSMVGKHIVFYRILKPTEVEIIRILHGSMNLKNRLEE